MYYEINVAAPNPKCGGQVMHLFATAHRSIQDEGKAIEVLRTIDEKFPASEGYHVTVSYWPESGHEVAGALRKKMAQKK